MVVLEIKLGLEITEVVAVVVQVLLELPQVPQVLAMVELDFAQP
jgi:hypothetical protein